MRDVTAADLHAATYRVQMGHLTVTVCGDSQSDAIRQARQKLCEEMPRLWDVIHTRQDSDFIVTPEK